MDNPSMILGGIAAVIVIAFVIYYVYNNEAKKKHRKKPHPSPGPAGEGVGSAMANAKAHGYDRYSSACGKGGWNNCYGYGTCDPQTGFETVESCGMMPVPKDCYFGDQDARYENLGSYVKSKYYTSGCISEGCNNDLASRSRCKKVDKPPYAERYGLSSADMMFPGPSEGCGDYCNMDVSRYDPCNIGMLACDPCKVSDDCHPFDDTVIDEPRDLAYLDGIRADGLTFVTTNFNQTTDLRGDIPVGIPQCALHADPNQCEACCYAPAGASLSTHGAFLSTVPYRGYVY